MIITFWSPFHGVGTSSNLLALSIMNVLERKRNTLLINAQSGRRLEKSTLGPYYNDAIEDIGIDVLKRTSRVYSITAESIRNASYSLYQEKMHILPGTKKIKGLFDSDIANEIPNIVEKAKVFYDDIFIDLESGHNESYQNIICNTDLLVVNLPQNNMDINEYFNKYNFDTKKVVYLIGKYDPDSCLNLKNITRMFPIMKKKVAAIPYDVEYLDAISNSSVISYMQKNYIADNQFLKEVVKTGKLLINNERG